MTFATHRPLARMALPPRGPMRRLAQGVILIGGAALIALSARAVVEIGPVDLSLLSLAVMLIATLCGLRLGLGIVLLHLAGGAAGLPVFPGAAEDERGLAYITGPAGGYLVGLIAIAAIMGAAADRGWDHTIRKLFVAALASTLVYFALGYAWLAVLFDASLAWTFGVAPFVLSALFKIGIATLVPVLLWALVARFRQGD